MVRRLSRRGGDEETPEEAQRMSESWEVRFAGPPVDRPTLILDERRVRRNIARMAERARHAGVHLRPHFKTHQSPEIGAWFRDHGVDAITVSSFAMAVAFADHGWTDITVAFPLNVREMAAVNALAPRIRLGLLVDSRAAVETLACDLTAPVQVWIKIDAGYGRAGLSWDRPREALDLARRIRETPRLDFQGLLTHSGHSYRQPDTASILRVHAQSLERLEQVRAMLAAGGIASCRLSVGDTPTCSLAESFPGVAEIRPGNFVFHDLMQLDLGVCAPEDLAVALACPVVSVYPRRGEIVIYGGAVHLSTERLAPVDDVPHFGRLALREAPGPAAAGLGTAGRRLPLVGLSQEHGVARLPEAFLARVRVGDLVLVHPVHSCLTCDLHREYLTLEGRRIARI